METGGDALLNQIVFGMVPQQAISHVFVGGLPVIYGRLPTRVDPEQVRETALARRPKF